MIKENKKIKALVVEAFPPDLHNAILDHLEQIKVANKLDAICLANTWKDRADRYVIQAVDSAITDVLFRCSDTGQHSDFINMFCASKDKFDTENECSVQHKIAEIIYLIMRGSI